LTFVGAEEFDAAYKLVAEGQTNAAKMKERVGPAKK